ncbi:restriction endonuclease subunit S [Limosilactobacillus reuteri]|uniref:restriction endonuclease subunit S n=1 Tax=Limosilactobacillus reuteri TaxID=1598 RepID=UPI000A329ABE|nr:restriction endonuclease subunit S [Limosilactobacillus reuteri]
MDKKPEKMVPEVRFKGFTDDWEQRKLSSIAHQTFGGGTPSKSNKQFWNGDFPWIQSSDLAEDTIRGVHPNKFITQNALLISAAKKIPKNSIAIVSRVGVGKVALIPFNYSTSQDFLSLSGLKINSQFATYSIHKIMKKTASQLQGTSIKGITKKDILNKTIIFPISEKEQVHISSLLKYVDYIISLQQRKLEQLKQLKKAMLQQLFVDKNSKQPNLRFKNFNSDWKQRKLKNISKRILRKNSDLQSLLPLTISAQDGLVDQTLYFNKQVASKQLKNYLLLYNGDFAYNKSYSVGYPYGAIKRLDKYKQGVLSTLYIAFKPTNINSDFLQHYYDTDKWYREIYRNAAEGARNHGLLNISANDFFNSKLVTPSDNEEQLKIAKIINLFNHLITLRQDNLTQLTTLKKYLLQKLFI